MKKIFFNVIVFWPVPIFIYFFVLNKLFVLLVLLGILYYMNYYFICLIRFYSDSNITVIFLWSVFYNIFTIDSCYYYYYYFYPEFRGSFVVKSVVDWILHMVYFRTWFNLLYLTFSDISRIIHWKFCRNWWSSFWVYITI